MTQTQEVARRRSTEPEPQAQTPAQAREPEFSLAPPADIFEDGDGVRILLDMPEGMEAVYAEVRTARYRRSFTLTSELDSESIEASIKDGVLAIRIPKRAELKPRRIEVQTG